MGDVVRKSLVGNKSYRKFLTIAGEGWFTNDGAIVQGASGVAVFPILTCPSDFRILPAMKELLQGGLNGSVPVSPGRRFLIHLFAR